MTGGIAPATVIFVILMLMVSGCGGNSVVQDDSNARSTGTSDTLTATAPTPEVLVLDASFDRSVVEVRQGVTIEVVLEGYPTTGLEWTVVADGAPVLRQMGDPEFVPEEDALGAGGAGGVYIWRFAVEQAGPASLRMAYSRSWDEETPPEKMFEISIQAG